MILIIILSIIGTIIALIIITSNKKLKTIFTPVLCILEIISLFAGMPAGFFDDEEKDKKKRMNV